MLPFNSSQRGGQAPTVPTPKVTPPQVKAPGGPFYGADVPKPALPIKGR